MDLNLLLSTRDRVVSPGAAQAYLRQATSRGCAILAQFSIDAIFVIIDEPMGKRGGTLDGVYLRAAD
jgi:hypothetical protein